jgi:hypothetical protein
MKSLVERTIAYMKEQGLFVEKPPLFIYTLMNDAEKARQTLSSQLKVRPGQVSVHPDSPAGIPYLSVRACKQPKRPGYPTELSTVEFSIGEDSRITLHMDGPRFSCQRLEDEHIKGYEFLRKKLEKCETATLPNETFDILERLGEKHGLYGVGASYSEKELFDVANTNDSMALLKMMCQIAEAGLVEFDRGTSVTGNEYRITADGKKILNIPVPTD